MGRVFSSEQIRNHDYPEPEDFENAKQVFEDRINLGIGRGLLSGGCIYGSVAMGIQNRRSDFDTVILLTKEGPEERKAARRTLARITKETNGRIPINDSIAEPPDYLESGFHDLDYSFTKSLTGPRRLVFGNDPANYIVPNGIPSRSVLQSYITHKNRRLSAAYGAQDPLGVETGGLQRQLELPVAIARKTLDAISVLPGYQNLEFHSSDKANIIELGRKLFAQFQLTETFDDILTLNSVYDQHLQKLINQEISPQQYDDFILKMHAHLPKSIAWVKAVGAKILPLFNEAA